MNDPHKLLPEDISDETATAIDNLLGELAETWKWRYFTQIQRFHEDNRPELVSDPFEPLPPWKR
uniref:Uncharacterized protein n=1 Tax=Candidatus Kentrum sp. DK TaxID=2126562 RepID=A0A450SZG9_9GAMM|nr:MAG: hypothetical protein BECKDK2373B_GA0170837_108420 [Candidatus Kentron sp. DK]